MNRVRRRTVLKALGVTAASSCMLGTLRALSSTTTVEEAQAPVPPPQTNSGPVASAIHLNQLGYTPARKKIATIAWKLFPDETAAADDPRPFQVIAVPSMKVVFEAPLPAPELDEASGDLVSRADFSAFSATGRYQLQVAGLLSDIFPIGDDVYRDALRLTMRSYYGQRCGTKVDLGGGYKHAKCHTEGAFGPSSGRSGKLKNTGGWHDAGDYGRYIVNSAISTGTLLWAWELYPASVRGLTLNIPETGRKLPDSLAEIKWNLDWMLSMQSKEDGGVWHKQTSAKFCAFVLPEDDHLLSEVIGTGAAPFQSTSSSAGFAAVMAIAARVYREFDRRFAERCLAAARLAFAWSLRNPQVAFINPPGVTTGEYGSGSSDDAILWGAAELFRTTGEPAFGDLLRERLPSARGFHPVRVPAWGYVTSLALWSYALTPSADATLSEAIRTSTLETAATLKERSLSNGYGNTLAAADFHWGSNSNAGNQSLLLLITRRLAAKSQPGDNTDAAALDAAFANLDYLLGRNCFGVSWVTQLGTRPFQHPHHRPSAADKVKEPWPGLLAAGPNAHGGDDVADALPPGPPMRHWVDDQRAYSLNEVAINWNAPLVFLLAAANSPDR